MTRINTNVHVVCIQEHATPHVIHNWCLHNQLTMNFRTKCTIYVYQERHMGQLDFSYGGNSAGINSLTFRSTSRSQVNVEEPYPETTLEILQIALLIHHWMYTSIIKPIVCKHRIVAEIEPC